jgi:DNA-binding transcriptional regulator YiaG
MSHTAGQAGWDETKKDQLLERLRAKRNLPPAAERRRIRLGSGATIRDLAYVLGVSATAIVRWEKGSSPRKHKAEYAALLEELKRVAA